MPTGRRLEVVELLGNLVELILCKLELLLGLLVLLLPHISFGLDGCNLAFVVFGLDVGETEPKA